MTLSSNPVGASGGADALMTDVAAIYPQARAAFAMEVCALERDTRVSDLTADEIDSIIHAIISLPAVRSAFMKDKAL